MATRTQRRTQTRQQIRRGRQSYKRQELERYRTEFQKRATKEGYRIGPVALAREERQARRSLSRITHGRIVPSSWINDVIWDEKTGITIMYTKTGGKYKYRIPRDIYERWRKGDASCRTIDRRSKFRKRFWPGKNPSAGAFFDQHIRGHKEYEVK